MQRSWREDLESEHYGAAAWQKVLCSLTARGATTLGFPSCTQQLLMQRSWRKGHWHRCSAHFGLCPAKKVQLAQAGSLWGMPCPRPVSAIHLLPPSSRFSCAPLMAVPCRVHLHPAGSRLPGHTRHRRPRRSHGRCGTPRRAPTGQRRVLWRWQVSQCLAWPGWFHSSQLMAGPLALAWRLCTLWRWSTNHGQVPARACRRREHLPE